MKRARSTRPVDCPYVTKGGLKLQFALRHFGLDVAGAIAADLGCHQGGFTDCLLQHNAARVYAVDTGYGILAWTLRNDPRVIVCERTNLIHWRAPEPVDLIVIDAGWTRQRMAVPAALPSLNPSGEILALVKPQYETDRAQLKHGVLPSELLRSVMDQVRNELAPRCEIIGEAACPLTGSGGNVEVWLHLREERDRG